jgi:hypothetical protein
MTANLQLVSGDVALSGFEETLSNVWPESMGDSDLYLPFGKSPRWRQNAFRRI